MPKFLVLDGPKRSRSVQGVVQLMNKAIKYRNYSSILNKPPTAPEVDFHINYTHQKHRIYGSIIGGQTELWQCGHNNDIFVNVNVNKNENSFSMKITVRF